VLSCLDLELDIDENCFDFNLLVEFFWELNECIFLNGEE